MWTEDAVFIHWTRMPAVKNLAAEVEIRKLGFRERGMPTPHGHGTRDESVTMILPPYLNGTL